jgi:hypothetical protein
MIGTNTEISGDGDSRETIVDIDGYLRRFMEGSGKNKGRHPGERYASFDYCFNHFQQFREEARFPSLADHTGMQLSCLHLAFYLASWGMFRGSSFLLEKSVKFFEPLIVAISEMPKGVWAIDADRYTDDNIALLMECADTIAHGLDVTNKPTDTLITKIMLGVFGNIPAFDDNFKKGFGHSFGRNGLKMISKFYDDHKTRIDAKEIYTFDFSGNETKRRYTKAKIIDMIFFTKGIEEGKTPKVESVKPLEDKRLLVKFVNGVAKVYDCNQLLHLEMFQSLRNEAFFRSVKVDAGGVWRLLG